VLHHGPGDAGGGVETLVDVGEGALAGIVTLDDLLELVALA